jgi:hypothetical protein
MAFDSRMIILMVKAREERSDVRSADIDLDIRNYSRLVIIICRINIIVE